MKLNVCLSLLSLAVSPFAFGQTATSDPVGVINLTIPGNSDAVLAVPMLRTAEFKGAIKSISGSQITVIGNPGWVTNQFVQNLPSQTKTYAVQIASGSKEGLTGKITSNASNTITVQLDSAENLSGIITDDASPGNADQIDITPYWTPSTFVTGTIPQGSQILLLNSTFNGVNLSSSGSFGYDSGIWVDEDTFDEADHAPLNFGKAVIFRNNGPAAVNLSLHGSVPMSKHRAILRTYGGASQDISIGFSSPIPAKVGAIGLGWHEDDQLLVFNNSAVGFNKSASQVLYFTTSDGWVDDNFEPVGNTFELQPGQGYIFRKNATGSPATFVWSALQSYLTP